jgi:hypothetical protein
VFGFAPSVPSSLETAVPGFAVLWTAARLTVALAAIAAALSLAAGQPLFRRPAGRLLAALLVLVVLLPGSPRSAGELAAGYLPALAAAAWLAVCILLLRDDVCAWVLFGALTFGGRAAAELLVQPATSDRAAGWIGLLLTAGAAGALCAGRRRVATRPPDETEAPA